ncbi:MAG TPA: ATP-binding cassette domain-containing protein [Kofleriaceae bacterium]
MIDVRNATKRFRTVTAVDGVSLRVEPGQVVALLGPNGAGKTSLIRMILGIMLPDAGSIELRVGERAAVRADIGYLPEERGLHKGVPIVRTLEFYGALLGLPRKQARPRIDAWLGRLGLSDRAGEKIEALSKGNQQKVQLIATLLHEPSLVMLDEPFSGLDPINQELLIAVIGELRARRACVLLSAHQMSLVERVADRAIFVREGRIVREGSLSELRSDGTDLHELYVRLMGAS